MLISSSKINQSALFVNLRENLLSLYNFFDRNRLFPYAGNASSAKAAAILPQSPVLYTISQPLDQYLMAVRTTCIAPF